MKVYGFFGALRRRTLFQSQAQLALERCLGIIKKNQAALTSSQTEVAKNPTTLFGANSQPHASAPPAAPGAGGPPGGAPLPPQVAA